MATVTLYCSANWSNCLKDHVHWSLQRSPSYPSQLALSELSEEAWNQIFPTSVTGHVTSEIAKDDWERDWELGTSQGSNPGKSEVFQAFFFSLLLRY